MKNQSGGLLYGSPNFNSTPDRTLNANSDFDFYDEHTTISTTWDIQYMYPSNPGDFNVKYISRDNLSYPLVNSIEDPTTSSTTPHCESHIPCFGLNCPPVYGAVSISGVFNKFGTIKSQLESLVNAGDHDYLYNLVENVSTDNLDAVYTDLMNSTPSHDILTLACENELFTASMIENILVENSYGIKSIAVRDTLDNRDDILSEEQMENIYEAAESISTYEDLMYQIDYMNQEYTYNMNLSLNTLAWRDIVPMDSIIMYLDSINDFWSDIKLINIAFNNGDNSTAQDLFDDLENKTDETDELDDYSTLYEDVLDDIYTNHEGDFSQMTTSQTDILEDIAFKGTYAAAIAKYLLITYTEFEWESVICAPGQSSERKSKT